ncbi:MAG: hypothetical protein U0992_20335 [Planctomycetaceae bacterium]
MSLESVILGVLWIVGGRAKHVYAMSGNDSLATAAVLPRHVLRHAAADIAMCGQAGTTVLYAIPMMSWTVLTGAAFTAWIVALISLCWVIDAAWRRQSAALTVLGWMLAELSLGVLAATVFGWGAVCGWYPALATILPLVAIGRLPRHRESFEHWVSTIGAVRVCTVMTLAAVALGSLPVFTAEFRVAGMLSLAGLLWSAAAWQQPALRTAAMSVAGWQCLAGVLQLTNPALHSLIDFRLPLAPATALPLALMAVLLSLLWNSDWMRARSTAIWPTYHRYSYLVVAFVCVANTTLLHDAGLSAWEAIKSLSRSSDWSRPSSCGSPCVVPPRNRRQRRTGSPLATWANCMSGWRRKLRSSGRFTCGGWVCCISAASSGGLRLWCWRRCCSESVGPRLLHAAGTS